LKDARKQYSLSSDEVAEKERVSLLLDWSIDTQYALVDAASTSNFRMLKRSRAAINFPARNTHGDGGEDDSGRFGKIGT